MRTPEEVQKQRAEYFIKEMEEILVHNAFPSLQGATDNIGWLSNKCIELLLDKMDIRTKIEVAREVETRHPEWFEKWRRLSK